VTDAKNNLEIFDPVMVVYDSLGKPVQLDVYFCMDSVRRLALSRGHRRRQPDRRVANDAHRGRQPVS